MDTAARNSESAPGAILDPADPRIQRAATAVLGATSPESQAATSEISGIVAKSKDRGYFLPDEDDEIRVRYSRYLATRSVLLTTLTGIEAVAGGRDSEWERRLPAFAVALAAVCLVARGSQDWIALAGR